MFGRFSLKMLVPLGVLVALFIALMALSLAHIAREADLAEAEHSRTAVEAALGFEVDQIALIADDNALWDDAARAVYTAQSAPDFLWSAWGAPTLEGKNYEAMAVLDHSGKPRFAFARGRRIAGDSLIPGAAVLKALAAQADSSSKAAGGIIRTRDGFKLIGVARIRPISRALDSLVPAAGPDLIMFVRSLSPDLVGTIGEDLNLATLTLGGDASRAGQLIVRDPRGAAIGRLSWLPQRPGGEATQRALPLILGGSLIYLLLALIIGVRGYHAIHRLGRQALIDSLSGLPNRRELRNRLSRKLARGQPVALAMIDLDGFKLVNDSYGHQVGDRLIKDAADLLLHFVGGDGTVARLGGDEFAIMIAGSDALVRLEAVCRDVLGRFAQPFRIDERTVAVGVSIGLASAGIANFSASELLRRADVAMYAAKRAGKMRMNWYDELLDQRQVKAGNIESELRHALENEEFSVVYQPLYGADGTGIRAVETLLRWHSPVRGMVPPAEFIPVAEETGLIDRIGLYVLRKACEDGLNWPQLGIAVNISSAQLRNPIFTKQLAQLLDETGFPAHRLELEITETYLVYDPETARKVIASIRALGVSVALDDYGAGFTSIGFLRRFAFSKIKLDRNLIGEAATSEVARTILNSSVSVARVLDMRIAAGGIETAAQADLMRVAGCDQMQGWLFSEAVHAAEIDAILERIANAPEPVAQLIA